LTSKAIFLDRDGVINKERKDYVKNIKEFEINNGVAESIKFFKQHNYLLIIITNQSAIHRNLLSVSTLDEIHLHLKKYLKKNDTHLDAIYFCPHIPEENCACRKPKPGMLLQAAKDFDIDLKESWFIGDRQSDMDAAKSAGCRFYLLESGQNLLDISRKIINTTYD